MLTNLAYADVLLFSKKSGAAEQQRETILANLSGAYDGFIQVNSNLEEGTKFYSDLTQLLLRLQPRLYYFTHFILLVDIQ